MNSSAQKEYFLKQRAMIEQIDNHSEYYLDICKIEIYLH